MSVIISKDPFSQLVDGFQLPGMFSPDNFRSGVNYKARSDDIFIVTYPKCGTTWVQNILLLILQDGKPLRSLMEMMSRSPFLELLGSNSVEEMVRPGPIKTHLPFHLTPWNKEAKYIYVTRNPKDCCVSYFHHMRMGAHHFTGSFDQFFELFISGKIDFGDYFDHLLSWYSHRAEPNILFVTYEELKEDIDSAILRMASFIDDTRFAEPLRNNPELLNNIKLKTSFNEMKTVVNKGLEEMLNLTLEDMEKFEMPDVLKNFILEARKKSTSVEHPEDNQQNTNQFVRKGIVGDWKNYLSADQCQRLEQKFAERTNGTDISNYWKKYM